MFSGEFEHNLDDKGRLTIPVRFREALAGGVFVIRGPDGCLLAFAPADWEVKAKQVAALSWTQESARFLARMVYSAADLQLDKQGRILLPAPLREYANLENEVVIVGVNTYLEIWSKARWRDVVSRMEHEGSQLAEHLSLSGI
jgi:MraZ protein